MRPLLEKYAAKLVTAGLSASVGAPQERALLAGLDDELIWNRDNEENDPRIPLLSPLFQKLSINSLVCMRPSEPYAGIVRHLAEKALQEATAAGKGAYPAILPQDCETRTFLHDLPVVRGFDPDTLAKVLARRKGVIILSDDQDDSAPTVLAYGTVSPEQGYVTASSICLACFVKFFADALAYARFQDASGVSEPPPHLLQRAIETLRPLAPDAPPLMRAPFADAEQVHLALIQAGRATVEYGLVDSYFGNISYRYGITLYISQTGSSLEELAGHIDPCPLDMEEGGSTAGLTASSELSAHIEALARTGAKAMLHGHPPFCVIMSLDCPKQSCPNKGRCHLDCTEPREILGTPIVPGEVGTGTYGLCNTLPPALEKAPAAIVYGHGLFALGQEDFNEAFSTLLEVERRCRETCLKQLKKAYSVKIP